MLPERWCVKINKFMAYPPEVGRLCANVSAAEPFLLDGVVNVSTVLEIS